MFRGLGKILHILDESPAICGVDGPILALDAAVLGNIVDSKKVTASLACHE